MSVASYVMGVAAATVTLLVVVEMLRQRRLRERHAIWWLVAGLLALIGAVFPTVLEVVATLVGVEVPINLVFFVSIATLFLVSIQHSSELTTLESKTRALAEQVGILELELRRERANIELDDGEPEPSASPGTRHVNDRADRRSQAEG